MKIVMIGSGYVGLVSGACFSEFGNNVTCIDKDEKIIKQLNSGELPIYEPGLDDILAVDKWAREIVCEQVNKGAFQPGK